MAVNIDDAAIHELFADPTGPVGRLIEQKTIAVENRVKELLLMPGSGRVYTTRFFTDAAGRVHPIGHRPPHRASAPGAPPASDTGQLLSSVGHRMEVRNTVVGVVGYFGVKHGDYLEYGTSKMLPRPALRPALDAART